MRTRRVRHPDPDLNDPWDRHGPGARQDPPPGGQPAAPPRDGVTRRGAGLAALAGIAGATRVAGLGATAGAGTAGLASMAGALGTFGALLAAPGTARAQQKPTPGKDFISLKHPFKPGGDGRVEVVDFFWYGCPHCFAFESVLEPWAAKLPSTVRFSRVPYGFDDDLRQTHQRIFYTLEAIGQAQAMHPRVFARFHVKRQPINTAADMSAFARENGLDVARVDAAWNSFSVQTRLRQAQALCDAYGIDFVPALGIHGRFLANPAVDHDGPRALSVTDYLIDLVRQGH